MNSFLYFFYEWKGDLKYNVGREWKHGNESNIPLIIIKYQFPIHE